MNNELQKLNDFLVNMNKQLAELADLSANAVKRPSSSNRTVLLNSIFSEQEKLLNASKAVCEEIKKLFNRQNP